MVSFTLSIKELESVVFGVAIDDNGRIWSTVFTERNRKNAVEALLKNLPIDSSFKEENNEYTDKILDCLISLAEGKGTTSRYKLAMDTSPTYYRKVYRTLQKVPRGKVVSYGGLAKATGSGRAARAVGNAMKKNPFPLFVPCHRVIKSDRCLGGFGGGVALKEKILLKEGVLLKNGKVNWTSLVLPGEFKK